MTPNDIFFDLDFVLHHCASVHTLIHFDIIHPRVIFPELLRHALAGSRMNFGEIGWGGEVQLPIVQSPQSIWVRPLDQPSLPGFISDLRPWYLSPW